MNATEQARAGLQLEKALELTGLRVERLVNDAARIGRTKHSLEPVPTASLIGVWLAKGYVVTVEAPAAAPEPGGADR